MLNGDKLRFLRVTHGIRQKDMADWCAMSPRYVSGIERNEYSPSKEIYDAWLNCCYGDGEPIKRSENRHGSPPKEKK